MLVLNAGMHIITANELVQVTACRPLVLALCPCSGFWSQFYRKHLICLGPNPNPGNSGSWQPYIHVLPLWTKAGFLYSPCSPWMYRNLSAPLPDQKIVHWKALLLDRQWNGMFFRSQRDLIWLSGLTLPICHSQTATVNSGWIYNRNQVQGIYNSFLLKT